MNGNQLQKQNHSYEFIFLLHHHRHHGDCNCTRNCSTYAIFFRIKCYMYSLVNKHKFKRKHDREETQKNMKEL